VKTRVGIFGGSFDPPTNAHLQVGEQLVDKKIVDEVWYMPALSTSHGKQLVDFQDRVDMLYELISNSDYFNELHVCLYEKQCDSNGRTLDTMTQFIQYYSQSSIDYEFYFIIGMDNALNIHKFYRWNDLINLMPFIVLDRKNNRGGKIGKINHTTDELWFNRNPHIYVDDIEIMGASSTQIRNELCMMYSAHGGLSATFFEMCNFNVFKCIIDKGIYK